MGVNGTILREYRIRCYLRTAVFRCIPAVKPVIAAAGRDWQAFQFSVRAGCSRGRCHAAAIGMEGNVVADSRGIDRNFLYGRFRYAAFCICNCHAAIIHCQCAGWSYCISRHRLLWTICITRSHHHTGAVKSFSFRINGFPWCGCYGYGI